MSKNFTHCAMKWRALKPSALDWNGVTNAALGWTGVALAGASAVFAIRMIAGQHDPLIRDMQYLAIFTQPNSAALRHVQPSSALVLAEARSSQGIDYTATASIQKSMAAPFQHSRSETPAYEILGATEETAWLRVGLSIVEVRKGQAVPGIGKILAIERRGDAWRLVIDDGRAAREETSPLARKAKTTRSLEKKLIFGDKER